jgi:hypothetical protein
MKGAGYIRTGLPALAAFLVAPPSLAQTQVGPYRLVITYTPGGIAVIDYPSAAQCDRARAGLEADRARRTQEASANAPQGAVVVGTPYHLRGVCIPG